jgi:hypothetical protein
LVGKSGYGGASFWSGDLANVAIFDDALTEAEIQTLYYKGDVPDDHDHLVSYWPLDGDYLDWKGSNHGTNNGATSIKVIDGPMGKRNFDLDNTLNFDGVDDYVNISDSNDFTMSAMTISVWVNPRTTQHPSIGDNRILSKWDNGAGAREWILLEQFGSGGQIRMTIADSGGSNSMIVESSQILKPGEWMHIATTWNGGFDATDLKLYINGAEDNDTQTESGTFTGMNNTATDVLIGAQYNSAATGGFFNGEIADVKIYDDALTADEVLWAYTNGAIGTDPTETNLQGHWELDEGAGSTADDSSSNSHDGTITSATWQHSTRPPMNLTSQASINLSALSLSEPIYIQSMTNDYNDIPSPFAFSEWTLYYTASSSGEIVFNSLFFGTVF